MMVMGVADKIESVHHTAVCVVDFERMRDFFVGFLGFEIEGEMDHRAEAGLEKVVGLPGATIRWAMLRFGTHRVELFKYYQPTGNTVPLAQCDTGFTHMAFRVSDVDAIYTRAVQAGYSPISEPQLMRGGITKAFYLRGPEDVVVEFIEFPQEGGPS